jgi:LmbE family N-acetylglucosaminyl deacetylase
MATLNQDEQAKVDALAALEQAKWNNERYVPDVELANARQLVAYAEANAEAREQRTVDLKAEEDKKTAAVTAARDALARAAQAEYMRRRHASFKGTAAQWEQMKGAILSDFLLGANEGRDEAAERKRASMEYGF